MTTGNGPARRRPDIMRVSMIVMGLAIISLMVIRVLVARERDRPLPILAEIPAFTLVDQTGSEFPSSELDGKVWVASFLYSTCPGPCPRIVGRLSEIDRRLAGESAFRMVSFTVDPEADTPEVLGIYGKTHAILPSRWKLLTGAPDEQLDLIRRGFMMPVQRSEGLTEEQIKESGAVIHSVRLVLVDGLGRMRAYYDSGDPDEVERLIGDARRLLRAQGR